MTYDCDSSFVALGEKLLHVSEAATKYCELMYTCSLHRHVRLPPGEMIAVLLKLSHVVSTLSNTVATCANIRRNTFSLSAVQYIVVLLKVLQLSNQRHSAVHLVCHTKSLEHETQQLHARPQNHTHIHHDIHIRKFGSLSGRPQAPETEKGVRSI